MKLIRSTKQLFVSDTQPIRAIAPVIRSVVHHRSRAGGQRKRSKARSSLFAARSRRCTEDGCDAALKSLGGEIAERPPMYPAKKVQGKKLYELARRGESVERK